MWGAVGATRNQAFEATSPRYPCDNRGVASFREFAQEMSLTPEQLRAVSLFSEGLKNTQIAHELGVTPRCIQRWHKIPEFASAVAQIKKKAAEKTIEATATNISNRIQSLLPKALGVIEHYLDSDEARASDRLRACHLVGTWAGLTQQKAPVSPSKGEEPQSQTGLSEDIIEQIRSQILGVK